jgi:molecular chaperone DnaK
MRVVGIDLGTTNSVVAYVDEAGEAHAISDSDGKRIVPSAVWFRPDDKTRVEVGELAKRQRTIDPGNVATLFKRGMGEATFQDDKKPFVAHGQEWRPEVLSSIVVKKLVGVAEAFLRETITDVVITIPAYFGGPERAATRQAGELAGLNVHLLPAEPMAAAVAHGLDSATGPATILAQRTRRTT